jgi:hypothetical protein
VADGDFVTFNDDGHLAGAIGILQHLLQLGFVFVDIVIHGITIG